MPSRLMSFMGTTLQGSNPFLQGSSVSLQGSSPSLQGSQAGNLNQSGTPLKYTYKPNGKGGVDYFYGDKPITNAQYAAATGENTNTIEANISKNSKTLQDVIPTNGVTINSPATGSSSIDPSSYYLHGQDVNGQQFDLTDPAQQEAFRQAQLGNLGSARDTTIRQLQQGVQTGLTQAQAQDQAALAGYGQNAADFGRSLANNVVNLGQGYDLGLVNSQQQFAGMSPNAFQSGQGTSQQYAGDMYNKGLSELRNQQNENVGADYLTSGQIDPNSTLGRSIGLENANYNAFTQNANYTLQNGTQAANVAYQGGADQVNNNLLNLNSYAGRTSPTTIQGVGYNYSGPTGNLGSYQTPQGNPYTTPSFDISRYTPYANSSQLSQSPGAQPSSPATWTGSGNPFSGLLGYNPNANQSNYLNAFTGKTPATASGS